MVLQRIEKLKINEAAKKQLLAIVESKGDYKGRQGESRFDTLLLTIADNYPLDKVKILGTFTNQKPRPKTPVKSVNVTPKDTGNDEGCIGCTNKEGEKLKDLTSIEEVLNFFASNAGAMATFLKMNRHPIPKGKHNDMSALAYEIFNNKHKFFE